MSKRVTRDLILWTTLLGGPVFWLLSFEAKFSWTPWACDAQSKLALFAFALTAFLLTAVAGLFAWREWRSLGSGQSEEGADTLARSRFMALGGMAFSAGFCMVIVSQAIPDIMLGVCQ